MKIDLANPIGKPQELIKNGVNFTREINFSTSQAAGGAGQKMKLNDFVQEASVKFCKQSRTAHPTPPQPESQICYCCTAANTNLVQSRWNWCTLKRWYLTFPTADRMQGIEKSCSFHLRSCVKYFSEIILREIWASRMCHKISENTTVENKKSFCLSRAVLADPSLTNLAGSSSVQHL